MSGLLAFIAIVSLAPIAIAAAMWGSDELNKHFWRRYGYCPTCDRLREPEETP